MKVERIRYYIDEFIKTIQKANPINDLHFEEVVLNWQNHWDLKSSPLSKTYTNSLNSKISAEIWGGSRYSPKSMMILMIDTNEEFMRSAFSDLFNENKELALRIERFRFHCDEILEVIQAKDKKINTHYHEDKKNILMYLVMEYPENYCFWNYDNFFKMMKKLESINIPTEVETERYYKSCRAIYNLISKDNGIPELWQQYLFKNSLNSKPNLVFMNHFMNFVSAF
ncbi:MAG: hypothetical protein IPM42_18405 [Saprospiraceae bacterium]|nr:hypothetical protein [Saprospiraceae bacterium]